MVTRLSCRVAGASQSMSEAVMSELGTDSAQGSVPGCPGQFNPGACPRPRQTEPPVMKLILDRLADLELAIPDWSDSA
jgi:hypothetical protein